MTLIYFLYSAVALGLLYVFGFAFTLLLLSRPSPAQLLIVPPWVGYCYGIFVTWHVYYFDGVLNGMWLALMTAPPLLLLLAVLLRRKLPAFGRDTLIVFLALTLTIGGIFATASSAMLGVREGLTGVSLGNHDIALYAGSSRFLTSFPRNSAIGWQQTLVEVMDYNYFGTPAFTALASVLLNLLPHESITLCTNIFLALTAAAVGVVVIDSLKARWETGLIGAALTGFHPLLLYIAFHGFSSQLAGMGLASMMFWAWERITPLPILQREGIRGFCLLSVFTLALFLTYQHMLPFVWFFMATYTAVRSWREGTSRPLSFCFLVNGAAFTLCILLCPQRILALFLTLKGTATVNNGWFIRFLTPDLLVGLVYENVFLLPRPWILTGVTLLTSSALLLISFFLAYRKRRYPLVALVVSFAAIYLGAILLAVIGRGNSGIGGYKSFKLVVFFLPFLLAAIAACFELNPLQSKSLSRALRLTIVLVLIHAYFIADRRLINVVVYDGKRVERSFADLLRVDANPDIRSINILGSNWWATMWAGYFLLHKQLQFQTSTYYSASQLIGTHDLLDLSEGGRPLMVDGVFRVSGSEIISRRSDVIKVNKRFLVVKHQNLKDGFSARLGTGWYDDETDHIWTGSDGRKSSLILTTSKTLGVRLKISYTALEANNTLTVRLENQRLATSQSAGQSDLQVIEISRITLKPGQNTLEFESESDPRPPSNGDPRSLSYSFRAIEIELL